MTNIDEGPMSVRTSQCRQEVCIDEVLRGQSIHTIQMCTQAVPAKASIWACSEGSHRWRWMPKSTRRNSFCTDLGPSPPGASGTEPSRSSTWPPRLAMAAPEPEAGAPARRTRVRDGLRHRRETPAESTHTHTPFLSFPVDGICASRARVNSKHFHTVDWDVDRRRHEGLRSGLHTRPTRLEGVVGLGYDPPLPAQG